MILWVHELGNVNAFSGSMAAVALWWVFDTAVVLWLLWEV